MFGTVPMRPGFDRNSKDSKLFASFSQFEVEIVIGFWLGERKQLKNERTFKCLRLNR